MIQSGILRFSFFVLIAIIVILIGIIFIYYEDKINPFPEVSWIEDQPGATERYVVFTPVLKSNHEVVILGPTVGADYATLRFKDIDNDGVKEAIIETKILFDFGEYRSTERHILKYHRGQTGIPVFILFSSESFPEKDH